MDFKATEIAAFLNGEVVGEEGVKVSGISKIEDGKPGTLAFLSNMKYENFIYSTNASIVLVNKEFIPKEEIKATLIKVEDAYQGFASLLEMYAEATKSRKTGIEQPSFIENTAAVGENCFIGAFAYIGKNSKIGDGVKIFPQVHIGENISIGDNCIIYAGAKIYNDSIIGDNCVIHAGVVIGSDGFGFAPNADGTFKKIPQIGNVVIEDNVEIGANSTIDCGTMGSTTIRKGVKIDNLVQVAHNVEIGENTVIAAQTGISGSTKIGKNCIVAGQVGIVGHVTIGDNSTIGAKSGVNHSLKEKSKVFGSPAFNYRDSLKSSAVFKVLPQLRMEVNSLQKEINTLKNNNIESTNS